jgi:hypothetical protein
MHACHSGPVMSSSSSAAGMQMPTAVEHSGNRPVVASTRATEQRPATFARAHRTGDRCSRLAFGEGTDSAIWSPMRRTSRTERAPHNPRPRTTRGDVTKRRFKAHASPVGWSRGPRRGHDEPAAAGSWWGDISAARWGP